MLEGGQLIAAQRLGMDHHGPQIAAYARVSVQSLGIGIYVLLGCGVSVAVRQ